MLIITSMEKKTPQGQGGGGVGRGALTLLFVKCDLQLLVCSLRRSNLSCHRGRVESKV